MIKLLLRYTLSRLFQAVPVMIVASLLAFAITAAANPEPQGSSMAERYAGYVFAALGGSFGTSEKLSASVGAEVMQRLPASLELAIVAFVLSLAIGVPAGLAAALRGRQRSGQAVMALATLVSSVPVIVSGTLLLYILAFKLRWFPLRLPGTGAGEACLFLPAITLAAFQAAQSMRLLRDGIERTLESSFIRFARSRGLPRFQIVRHAVANALVPVVTAAVSQTGSMLALLVVAETIFQWPGAGAMFASAAAAGDAPVLAALLLITAVVFLAVSIVSGVLSFALDPRIRRAHGAGGDMP